MQLATSEGSTARGRRGKDCTRSSLPTTHSATPELLADGAQAARLVWRRLHGLRNTLLVDLAPICRATTKGGGQLRCSNLLCISWACSEGPCKQPC